MTATPHNFEEADGGRVIPQSAYDNFPRVFTGEEIFEMADPRWLLEDFIQEKGLTVLYGEPGHGKSLIAQAWANVLAAPETQGKEWAWMGRERIERTNVLYIMGEGQAGLKGRLLAWMQDRKFETPPPVQWIMQPLTLWRPPAQLYFSDEQEVLLEYIQEQKIGTFIVDTLAATYGGGNENMQQDMNQYVGFLQAVQALGTATVVVHHNARGSVEPRGSTVLKGAADSVLRVSGDLKDGILAQTTLRVSKQKDGTPFKPIFMRPVSYIVNTETGKTAIALAYAEKKIPGTDGGENVDLQDRIVEVLDLNPGMKITALRDRVVGSNTKIADALDALVKAEDISEQAGGYYVGSAPPTAETL